MFCLLTYSVPVLLMDIGGRVGLSTHQVINMVKYYGTSILTGGWVWFLCPRLRPSTTTTTTAAAAVPPRPRRLGGGEVGKRGVDGAVLGCRFPRTHRRARQLDHLLETVDGHPRLLGGLFLGRRSMLGGELLLDAGRRFGRGVGVVVVVDADRPRLRVGLPLGEQPSTFAFHVAQVVGKVETHLDTTPSHRY